MNWRKKSKKDWGRLDLNSNKSSKWAISDFVEIIGGGTPKTSISEYWNGSIPWLSVKDFGNDDRYVFETEKTITNEGLNNSSTKLLQKDDIIISARGTVGELAMLPFPMAFNQSCYGIRPKDDSIDKTFLYYLLRNSVQLLRKNTHGSVFDTITRDTFKGIEVEVPSIEEQVKIAGILSSLDDKIAENKKINHHLEQIAHSIFKSWFVDFNSFGGDVPASWNEELLFDLATVTYGKNLPTKKLLSSGYRVFGGNGQIGYYSEYLYKKERILISCRGAASGTVRLSRPYSFVTNNSLIVNEKEPELFAYLKEWSLNRQFFDAVTGSAQPQVTVDSLKLISLPKPDKETLEKFTNLLMPIYNEIEANTTECEKLVILRDTLLPKLMTGEISVTD